MKKFKIIMATMLALPVLVVPVIVMAEDTSSSSGDASATEQAELEKKKAEKERLKAEEKKKQQKKLEEKKKKACENRRESFKKRMEGIAERSQKRLEVFDKIADKVEAFNEDKNLNIENYDQLLADVKAKRQAVHDAHEAAKESAGSFECEKGQHKTSIATFKTALQNEIKAFNDYKKSLKNLIAAVKAAAVKAEEGASNEN